MSLYYFDIMQHRAVDLYSIGVLYGDKISFVQLIKHTVFKFIRDKSLTRARNCHLSMYYRLRYMIRQISTGSVALTGIEDTPKPLYFSLFSIVDMMLQRTYSTICACTINNVPPRTLLIDSIIFTICILSKSIYYNLLEL